MKIKLNDLRGTDAEPSPPAAMQAEPAQGSQRYRNDHESQGPLPEPVSQNIQPSQSNAAQLRELDCESVKEIERIEKILAKGRRSFFRLHVLKMILIVAVITALKLIMKNRYWYFIPLCFPVYLLAAILGASRSWEKLSKQIDDIRAGKPVRLPRDAHEAQFIMGFGLAVLLAASIIQLDYPSIQREWTVMMLISGSTIAIWGAIKFSRSVWTTPKEKRISGARALAILWWMTTALVLTVGFAMDPVMDWMLPRYTSRRLTAQQEAKLKKLENDINTSLKHADELLKKAEAKQKDN